MTASIFGMAIYFPFEFLMDPLLQVAHPLFDSKPFPCDIREDKVISASLWPRSHFEPDGVWNLENRTLVLEIKRPDELHTSEQIIKYFEGIDNILNKRNKAKHEIWILTVGKRSINNVFQENLKLSDNWNLLYLEWSEILGKLKELRRKNKNHLKRILLDMIKFLESGSLKYYEGIIWPKNIAILDNEWNFKKNIFVGWYSSRPIFNMLPDLKINQYLPFRWLC